RMAAAPTFSVIMPIRNEAERIEPTLRSVLAQDLPPDRMEVLVVDGRSDDDTREVVARVAGDDPRVRLLDNPERIVPTALNRGLAEARGDVIVRVDGHCALPPGYLARCESMLAETGADCVGGMVESRPSGEGVVARAIALAMASPFGTGAGFRVGRAEPGPVDTLAFGAYRRDVFDRIGGFDPELVRNQDDEFNLRLTRAGGTIWMDPSLRSPYWTRGDLRSLWRQYFQYGVFKVRVAQKHRGVASWRHLAPLALVIALLGGAGLSLALRRRCPLLIVAGPYAAGTAAAAAVTGRRDPATIPVLPAAFACLQLSYGAGWLAGLWRWRNRFRA
ncbi:MAG TPA: glycosyltransferase family 2 protein, partial [Acidimicrobiales bacterium]|nr:glycosyltransferase family 2 protein [Acidimicrobiales bacterium]